MTLIDRGVCAAVVYDTPTALRDGVASTGHSLPQPNTWGPLPRHVAMDAGDTPWQEMVALGVARSVHHAGFWYVRDVHPLRTVITGMTREGTFLIENGRITRPVKDLRFTQSIVEALANVAAGEPRAAARARRRRIRGTVTLVAHRSFQLHVLATIGKSAAMTRSPLIGITLRALHEKGLPAELARNRAYFDALEGAGATPLGISASLSEPRLRELFDLCDGALPPGRPGRRADAVRRGDARRLRRRGRRPISIVRRCCWRGWALEADKPVLAICRGAQVLNVALGGTLWQDVGTQGATEHNHSQDGSRQELTHNIDVLPDSRLHAIAGARSST